MSMCFLLGSALLLPLCGGSTIYGYKEAFAHVSDLTAQVSPQGSAQIKRHKLLRKEARLDDHHFREQLPGAASLLAESGRISKTRRARRARARYLPQYPTGPATCDGSQLPCPSDSSVDPCSQLQNCSTGAYHDCQGSLKICLPNKDVPSRCESGDDCLLRCTGIFVEEKSDGSQGAPLCTDLSHDVCNGHYVADKDYTNNGLGFECALKDDKTCGNAQLCGVQNPPESLGEKQCYEPDVFKGATDGTCETTRTRPGHECKTRCYTGYSPSVATLKCAETGEFSPTTFTCEPNPCQVKSVQNALASGCKEGPSSGEATINSGESCTTQCKAGFYPSVERLRCHSETLSPATFTCEAACTVPTVANAAAGGVCKEAKEGEKILPFTDCSTQCAAGYTPSVRFMSCRTGSFTPTTVQCNADPCEAPSGVKFVSKDGPCKEGLTLTSGSNCEAQCLAGYTPSAAKLACQAGSLTPATFMCAANPCVLPTVEQSNGNGCKGIAGTSIESGQACNTICEAGYSPSVESLSCLAATLTPATFACNADPCTIPYDKNQAGSGCIDVELKDGATTIESSQKCQAQCKEGYHPSAVSLSCFAAGLTPATWSCLEDPCIPPKNIKNAPELTCRQGDSIVSGTGCTTLCDKGYTPNYKSLSCHLGEFSPPTYVCQPDPCAVHAVPNRLGSGCKDVKHPALIGSGASCTTQCRKGFSPSVAAQKCFAGSMTPTFWSCLEDPCDAPTGVRHTDAPCKEGKSVSSGQLCTAQCADGYSPSVPSLFCSLGQLTPQTFDCAPDPCPIPHVPNKHGSGCKGIHGTTVNAGSSCTPACKTGFSPSESSLQCAASKLTPGTFVCEPDSCSITPIEKAHGTGCNDGMRSRITSGGECEAKCQDGYQPSSAKLGCYAGIFTPSTFTCDPSPCTIPQVTNKAGSGCAGVPETAIASGTTCKAHCLGGYSPSESQLTCTAGTLAPATFECSPDPCPMPTVSNQKGNGCKSMRGKVIASGAVCQAECIRGYTPSVAKLDCFAGRLTPNSYMCKEDGCKAVTGVPNAPSVGCQEGGLILGGKSCTPRCNAGYSPSETTLACSRGVLTPVSFECKADSCDVPYVANSQNPTCTEGNSIEHNKKCTPRCQANYVASTGQLSCTAGSLSPSTFVCKAPCAAPNALNAQSLCKEGNLIIHGKSCTTQCDAGYQPNKASLECNDGVLTGGPVWCEAGPPPIGGDFYNCWTGDPHFVCRNGKRTDPLTPGSHWVLKQSCPGSPNFMWVQGLFGPVRPAVTMGVAFGGYFLAKNVLTIRVNNNPSWIVKWNGQNIVNAWKKTGRRSYTLDLFGTELSVNWKSNRIEVGMSYGVTYKATRHHWNRQNWKVNGYFYKDFYMNNQLWTKTCKDVILKGEAVEIHRGYKPHKDDRIVSGDVDMWQKSNAQIEAKLDSLTTVASLLDEDDIFVSDDVEMVNLNVSAGLNATAGLNASLALGGDTTCTGAALEAAKASCAVLKKEETEEEEEELEEDKEAADTQGLHRRRLHDCEQSVWRGSEGDGGRE